MIFEAFYNFDISRIICILELNFIDMVLFCYFNLPYIKYFQYLILGMYRKKYSRIVFGIQFGQWKSHPVLSDFKPPLPGQPKKNVTDRTVWWSRLLNENSIEDWGYIQRNKVKVAFNISTFSQNFQMRTKTFWGD